MVSIKNEVGGIVFAISNILNKPIDHPELLKQEFKKSEALSPGLGMGLWICDKIVQMHDSDLRLQQMDDCFVVKIRFANAAA